MDWEHMALLVLLNHGLTGNGVTGNHILCSTIGPQLLQKV